MNIDVNFFNLELKKSALSIKNFALSINCSKTAVQTVINKITWSNNLNCDDQIIIIIQNY